MKGKKGFFIALLIGTFIGWGLSNLMMPFDVARFSFLLGFVACLVFTSLFVLGWLFWKRKSSDGTELPDKSKPLIWLLKSFLIILTGVVGSFLMIRQNHIYKSQEIFQQQQIVQQNLLMQSIRNSGMGDLVNNLFNKIDKELANNPKRTLSQVTIDRAAVLSYSLKPYGQLDADSLSSRKLSPERGQLLLALSKMQLDSNSFNQIKSKGDFSGSDLMDADLNGANLRWAKLEEAKLRGADLRKADLSGVNLWGSDFWGAKLSDANLRGANLGRSDLKWVDLNRADLRDVDLRGVDLSDARLNGVDATNTDFEWSLLQNTSLQNATLVKARMFGTDLKRANLSKANCSESSFKRAKLMEAILIETDLSNTSLVETNFTNADLTGANLSYANLKNAVLSDSKLHYAKVSSKDWFNSIEQWNVAGTNYIKNNYSIIPDTSKNGKFILIPKDKK